MGKAPDRFVCALCGAVKPVASLARICEEKHLDEAESVSQNSPPTTSGNNEQHREA